MYMDKRDVNHTEMVNQYPHAHISDVNHKSIAVARTTYKLILKDIKSCQ